jgi:hypothetical protein
MDVFDRIEGTITVWRGRAKDLREQGGKYREEKAELIEAMCKELEVVLEKK